MPQILQGYSEAFLLVHATRIVLRVVERKEPRECTKEE